MSAGCSLCCWIQHTSSKPEKCLTIYDSIIYSDWFSKFASDSMSTSHHPSVKVGSEKYFAVLKVKEQHNPEPPPVTAPLRRQAVEHFFNRLIQLQRHEDRNRKLFLPHPITPDNSVLCVKQNSLSSIYTLHTLYAARTKLETSYLFGYLVLFISFCLLRFINFFFCLNQSCFSIFIFNSPEPLYFLLVFFPTLLLQ